MKRVKKAYSNPFPVTAVASFYNNIQNSLIVETNVIKRTKQIVERWIKVDNDGMTIAIQGEYGTGKTQLAIELRKYIKSHNEDKYHFICLDSPSVCFLQMYKNRFLNELTKEQVLERLEECYSQLIIDDLKDDELYGAITHNKQKLLKGTELIEQFGLPKSKYDRIFRENLERVTKSARFVPALQLLMVSQFENDIWDWFSGSEPSEALRERKIDFTINNDTLALEAIGIFAFLFGQQGHRLVLFIDEMEKITSNVLQTKEESFNALKKLFETVKVTKSMLILCGLPDYYDALPQDARQRIGHEIKTKAITLAEIKEYIAMANENTNNTKSCIPFTEAILDRILEISQGNIRTIIRLLYHSSNWYMDNNEEIDENALCVILKSAYGTSDASNVATILIKLIISKGWLFEENKVLKTVNNAVIDLWLPLVTNKKNSIEKGIEIYIVQNVISSEEYQGVCTKVSENTSNPKVLVVEGFISEQFFEPLSKKIFIMRYRENNFKELFISVIEGERAKYENEANQDNLLVMNEKIEQLLRIVHSSINHINDNFIGKQEFYYFMRKVIRDEREDFYSIPNKDSDFYLLLNEIQKIIDNINMIKTNKIDRHEIGALYFLREVNYILYYMIEKPQKINIPYTHHHIRRGYEWIRRIVREVTDNSSSFSYHYLNKYRFVFEYLDSYLESWESGNYIVGSNVTNEIYIGESFTGNFWEISASIKQISQDFCAFILINEPEVFVVYSDVFYNFYYLLYVGENDIVQSGEEYVDLVLIREYYDLIRKYTKESKFFTSRQSIERLFENYERSLRRSVYE